MWANAQRDGRPAEHRWRPLFNAAKLVVRPSGRGTVHSRPHKIFLQFQGLWTLIDKIREGVALTPLSILHKTH